MTKINKVFKFYVKPEPTITCLIDRLITNSVLVYNTLLTPERNRIQKMIESGVKPEYPLYEELCDSAYSRFDPTVSMSSPIKEFNIHHISGTLKTLETNLKKYAYNPIFYPRDKSDKVTGTVDIVSNGFTYDESLNEISIANVGIELTGDHAYPGEPIKITITRNSSGIYRLKALCIIDRYTGNKGNTLNNLTDEELKEMDIVLIPHINDLKEVQRAYSGASLRFKKDLNNPELKEDLEKNRLGVSDAQKKINRVKLEFLHNINNSL